jgi:uncharacterized membrane protein YobD (UPF0266 family)
MCLHEHLWKSWKSASSAPHYVTPLLHRHSHPSTVVLICALLLRVIVAELDEVKVGIQKHSMVIAMMFIYYSSIPPTRWCSSDIRKMNLERFRAMVEDIQILDPKAASCHSMHELDSIFVVR